MFTYFLTLSLFDAHGLNWPTNRDLLVRRVWTSAEIINRLEACLRSTVHRGLLGSKFHRIYKFVYLLSFSSHHGFFLFVLVGGSFLQSRCALLSPEQVCHRSVSCTVEYAPMWFIENYNRWMSLIVSRLSNQLRLICLWMAFQLSFSTSTLIIEFSS